MNLNFGSILQAKPRDTTRTVYLCFPYSNTLGKDGERPVFVTDQVPDFFTVDTAFQNIAVIPKLIESTEEESSNLTSFIEETVGQISEATKEREELAAEIAVLKEKIRKKNKELEKFRKGAEDVRASMELLINE